MSPILVILNPTAHSSKAGDVAGTIAALPEAVVALTAAPGDAHRLAAGAAARGFGTIVAAGGDGTINEIVNGIAGTRLKLGILPIGTMNVYASELGIPGKIDEAWEIVRAGRIREIDLAEANGQRFVQLAGVGLDAQVVKETSWAMKRDLGPLSYLVSAAQIAARKPPRLIVRAAERETEGSFVLIGNGRFYGGPFCIFQDALIDDGLLDVLVFQRMGYLDIARYLGNIFMGSHTELSDVIYFQTAEVTVTSDEAVPVEVDGELATELPVTFRIAEEKLRVIVP